jgi:fructokinase
MAPRTDRLDVVCFGEILWDLFESGPTGRPNRALQFRREFGGAPANVATGLARLGVRSGFVGAVGRDAFGDALLAHLRADGIETRFVRELPQRTGLTFVTRDARGEPRFLFYRHESADVSLRPEHVVPAMGRARWVLVGTSTLVTRPLARATGAFLDAAERAGARIVVDLNVRPHMWPDGSGMRRAIAALAERATLIKASDADLRALAVDGATRRGHGRRDPLDEDSAERDGSGEGDRGVGWLRRNAPQASWIVTRGSGGASALGVHGEVRVEALRARCVDATGAGDAFLAGSLATLVAAHAVPGSAGWKDPRLWREVLRAGHAMGKKAIARVGAVSGLHGLGGIAARVERVRSRYAAVDIADPRAGKIRRAS